MHAIFLNGRPIAVVDDQLAATLFNAAVQRPALLTHYQVESAEGPAVSRRESPTTARLVKPQTVEVMVGLAFHIDHAGQVIECHPGAALPAFRALAAPRDRRAVEKDGAMLVVQTGGAA